jgi:hypothetical protein
MRHLADHRSKPSAAKLVNFLRLARSAGERLLPRLQDDQRPPAQGNRRVLEFVRIERGRQV